MAATVSASAWSKPGAWALDSEENEAMEELQQQEKDKERENGHFDYGSNHHHQQQQQQPSAEFPSLAAAASTKSKKKKPQTLSLAEFNSGKSISYGSSKPAQTTQPKGLTAGELLVLPTGPRERTAEELERSSSRLGGGFRSYGSGGLHDNGRSRYSNGEDSSNPRWGSSRVSEEPRRNGGFNRELNGESGPSRADEIEDWGAAKKSMAPPAFERSERRGFFDSQSKADESDNWGSNKSFVPSEGRRVGSGYGFDSHRERRGGFDMFQNSNSNGGMDSDTWGKKREESNGSGRPKLVLQPRTRPVSNGEGSTPRIKGSNPFGEARPREEVLAEKGQDWKKIDEQLDSIKIKEIGSDRPVSSDGQLFGKKSVAENRTERNWRKTDSVDVPPPSVEKVDEDAAVVDN